MNTGTTMSDETKAFERLAYTSIALDVITAFAFDRTLETAIGAFAFGAVIGVLIWASARRGYRWATGAMLLWFAFGVLTSLSELWTAAPDWLHSAFTPSESVYQRLINLFTLVLLGAALGIYFSKPTRTQAPQT